MAADGPEREEERAAAPAAEPAPEAEAEGALLVAAQDEHAANAANRPAERRAAQSMPNLRRKENRFEAMSHTVSAVDADLARLQEDEGTLSAAMRSRTPF